MVQTYTKQDLFFQNSRVTATAAGPVSGETATFL
jgi:hypothetical protein